MAKSLENKVIAELVADLFLKRQLPVEIFDGAVVIFVLESGRRVLGSLGHLNIDKLLSTVLFKSL